MRMRVRLANGDTTCCTRLHVSSAVSQSEFSHPAWVTKPHREAFLSSLVNFRPPSWKFKLFINSLRCWGGSSSSCFRMGLPWRGNTRTAHCSLLRRRSRTSYYPSETTLVVTLVGLVGGDFCVRPSLKLARAYIESRPPSCFSIALNEDLDLRHRMHKLVDQTRRRNHSG